jgi:hypothetical protein
MPLNLRLKVKGIIGHGIPEILYDACQVSGKLGVLVEVELNGVHYDCNATSAGGYEPGTNRPGKLWDVQNGTCVQRST